MYGGQSLSDGCSMCDLCGVPGVIVSRCLTEGRVSGDESTVHLIEHEYAECSAPFVFHSSHAILL